MPHLLLKEYMHYQHEILKKIKQGENYKLEANENSPNEFLTVRCATLLLISVLAMLSALFTPLSDNLLTVDYFLMHLSVPDLTNLHIF